MPHTTQDFNASKAEAFAEAYEAAWDAAEFARATVVGELAEERSCELLKKLKEQAKEK